MNKAEIQNKIENERKDLANREKELAVLDAVIDQMSNRTDEDDPSPDYRKEKDFGLICDLAVLICPLHPLLVRHLPDGDKMQQNLSDYLHDKINVRGDYKKGDYTQEKGLENLRAFHSEKQMQYDDKKRKLKELTDGKG